METDYGAAQVCRMIKASKRLDRVKRVFDPYNNRREFIRLDRNEDPAGWDDYHFNKIISSLTPYDLAAYSDSTILQRKIAEWLKYKFENIYITSGSDQAIKNIYETYVDEGQKVIMQKPSWRMYDVYNDVYKGQSVFISYNDKLEWQPDEIIKLLNNTDIRLIIIANPNQPTGTITDKSKLLEIIELAEKKDTVVVIDEAYYMFTDETCVDLVSMFSNLLVVRTFSKAFGLASLRLGYVVANEERINELMLLRPVTDSNGIALKIGKYALDNIDWLATRVKEFIDGREFLYKKFTENGLKTFKSYTNFLLLKNPDIQSASNILKKTKAKNYLLKGPFNFSPLENCIRITVGPKNLMERFWDDCSEILLNKNKF